jgi:hypothetical protein
VRWTESQVAGKPGIWLNRRSPFTAGLLCDVIILRTYICRTGHARGVKILQSSGLQAGEVSIQSVQTYQSSHGQKQ